MTDHSRHLPRYFIVHHSLLHQYSSEGQPSEKLNLQNTKKLATKASFKMMRSTNTFLKPAFTQESHNP
ncbi:hypothetical protein L2E82_33648 [Cichorium intybus]|uniref:Uncharacterized protein n=1 Tax=Cichorium intybus TaxID=13427 RepID=A0ACB9BKR4_CICIN|nr:hypothetical protein L2E82_33648 [Cichorium intybus]